MTKSHSDMTTAELIERYNESEPPKKLTSWKKSKNELIRMIEEGAAPEVPSSDGVSEPDPQLVGDGPAVRPPSIASLCEGMISEGLSNRETADRVREQVPGARTSGKSVAWYRAKMKKDSRLKKRQ